MARSTDAKTLPSLIIGGLLAAACSFSLIHAQSAGEATAPYAAEITAESVRLRSGPSSNYQTVKVLTKSERLIAIDTKGEWVKVRIPSDVAVWISEQFVKAEGDDFVVKGKNVNLRIRPDTRYSPVGQISNKSVRLKLDEQGQRVTQNGFVQIIPPSEALAWVHQDFIVRAPEGTEGSAAETKAPAIDGGEAKADTSREETVSTTSNDSEAAEIARDAAQAANKVVIREPSDAEKAARDKADEVATLNSLVVALAAEIKKPAEEQDFSRLKVLFTQFAETTTTESSKATAMEKIEVIDKLETKLAEIRAEKEKREAAEAARIAKAEEAKRRAEEIRKSIEEKKNKAVQWLAEGLVMDHGRDAQMPASHALVDADSGKVICYLRWDTGRLADFWTKQVRVAGESKNYDGWDKPVIVISKIEEGTIPAPEVSKEEAPAEGEAKTPATEGKEEVKG